VQNLVGVFSPFLSIQRVQANRKTYFWESVSREADAGKFLWVNAGFMNHAILPA